ncbi:MAG: class I SAM-dependent methyltransferase [Pseudomonadota bacterium]
MASDTFDRSCEHWSEEGRAEMERFYEIASVDYRHLAEARDWPAWLKGKADGVDGRRPSILDVACGSGKFPTALNLYAGVDGADLAPIDYALLDPSRFSIDEARAALAAPFHPSTEFETTLQELHCPKGAFDIVWATHALYALPAAELAPALRRFVDACAGEGFIAHAFEDAHYIKFQRLFLSAFDRADETPFVSAEDVVAALREIGASFTVDEIAYENGAREDERVVVEGYLQRCVFDDRVTLAEMERAEGLEGYLADCREDGVWRFKQRVALISILP